MNEIYLDHAATSFPKAPGVGQAVAQFLEQRAVNINRGSYEGAVEGALEVLSVRQALCALFSFGGDARQCAFSSGVTMSLNLILQGLAKEGDHILISAMEHNAVARTAELLKTRGVQVEVVPCDETGRVIPEQFEAMLRPNTVLAAIQHASNVSGTVQPLKELGKLCHAHGIPLVVDAAQTAGHYPIQMDEWKLSAVAFPGHKGLLGPQGIGGAILRPELSKKICPLLTGGTGSESAKLEMPRRMPELLEAGTLNLPGICGLGKALSYIESTGIEALQTHERSLTERFMQSLRDNPHISIPGPDENGRVGVVSVRFLRRDNAEAAFLLEQDYGILTRCGLHCAPLAHKTLGTFPEGTVRFSFGPSTTVEEIDAAIKAIEAIC